MGKQVSFEALGRDVQAAADAVGDAAFANAVKDMVVWFADGNQAFSDGLWSVEASSSDESGSIAFSLVRADAYVAPVFPSAPALSAEQTAAQAAAAESVTVVPDDAAEGAADVQVQPDPAAAPAADGAAPVAAVAPEAVSVDPQVAASSDPLSVPPSDSSATDPAPAV